MNRPAVAPGLPLAALIARWNKHYAGNVAPPPPGKPHPLTKPKK